MFACLMVYNATFNNISVISWWPVLLVEETVGPGENQIHITVHVHVNIDFFFCVVYFKKKPFCPLIHRELWPLNGLIK
jgi:hypothetical protein